MTKFRLTKSQLSSIKKAAKENRKVTLTLGANQIDPNGVELPIDRSVFSDGKRHRVSFNPKSGGILPLIPILTGIALAAGTAGGVAGTVAGVKSSRSSDEVKKTAEIKGKLMGLKLKEAEELAKLKEIEDKKGSGLYLKSHGRGLHLKAGRGLHLKAGSGLHLKSGRGSRKRGGILPLLPAIAGIAALASGIKGIKESRARRGLGIKPRRKRGGILPLLPLVLGGLAAASAAGGAGAAVSRRVRGRGLKKRL